MPISRREFLISSTILATDPFAPPAIASGIQSIAPTLESLDFRQLDMLVDGAVTARNTPGIALTVWKSGKEIYSRTAGMANLETVTRVANASVFRIGSLTKQFTGALTLKLVSMEKISLSEPAHKYLPFLAKHEPFTILELLNHTAGVHDGDFDVTNPQTGSQIEQAQRMAQQNPFFDFRPGTAWLYSNANYILVGAIIEQVTGKPLAEAAAMLLFKPLDLHHTAFDTAGEIVEGRVSGYTIIETPVRPFQNAEYLDVRLAGAAGAMRSTASDLCRWQHALFHDKVFPTTLTVKMTLPGRLRNGQLASTNRFSNNDKSMGHTQYGLGLMLDNATKDKSLIANHHGGINGFAAYLACHLHSGLSYACLCNVDTHPGLPFRDIRRKIFVEVLESKTT